MHWMDLLNEEQRGAVTAPEPYVLVSAGPGTGKTHTLVRRIAHLVQNESVPADRVVVLTFTRKAAKELRSRLDSLSEDDPSCFREVWAGTVHARCAHLLRKKHAREEEGGEFTILDRDDQVDLLSRVLETLNLRGRSYRPDTLLRKISAVKNGETLQSQPDAWDDLLEGYRRELERWNALDYDDLQLRALEIPGEEAATPLHLLVDEFQDLNPLQHRLIRQWVGEGGTLFAIGDADQSIYGFRGASVEDFLQFEAVYPGARPLRLGANYRSGRAIVRSAGKVIAHNRRRMPLELSAQRRIEGIVRRVELPDERAEAEFTTREIEKLLGGSHSLSVHRLAETAGAEDREFHFGDIAVLFRTHALARDVRESLERAGYPVKESARDPRREDPWCRAACGLMQYLINPRDLRALGVWLRCAGRPPEGPETPGAGELPDRETALLAASFDRDPLNDFLGRVEDLLGEGKPGASTASWNLFRNGAGLFEGGTARKTAPDFLEHAMLKNPSEHFDDRASAISLLTIHAAKGLEFPVVFLIGAEDGLLPLKEGEGATDPEEERRLFYVAMTRARRLLTVTHCANRFVRGSRSSQRPSPFLDEMVAEGVRTERAVTERKPRKHKQKALW
jgi:superfamily I DNA/RNA helicase